MKNYTQILKIIHILILFLLYTSCSNQNTEIEANIISECEIDFLLPPIEPNHSRTKICGPDFIEINNFYTVLFLVSETKTAIEWEIISGSFTIEEVQTVITNDYTKSTAKIYINDDFNSGMIKAISVPDDLNISGSSAGISLDLNSLNQP